MAIQLHPSNDLLLVGYLMQILAGCALVALGYQFIPTVISRLFGIDITPHLLLIVTTLLLIAILANTVVCGLRIKAIICNTKVDKLYSLNNINRLIFKDNKLTHIWINNEVYSVVAYTCCKLFRSYLELQLNIRTAGEKSGITSLFLSIDESRVAGDDLCRLRRSFLLIPKANLSL